MDLLGPLLNLLVKSVVVLFPLTVGWLSFRRLALSKSTNAWTYATVCLLSAIIAAGVLPWSLGLTSLNWFLLLLAVCSPMLWVATIFVCDLSRVSRYGSDPLMDKARKLAVRTAPKLAPLVLQEEQRAEVITPVFRHQPPRPLPEPVKPARSAATTTLLKLARDIRDNATSERRRPKLLPAPETAKLAFLRKPNA